MTRSTPPDADSGGAAASEKAARSVRFTALAIAVPFLLLVIAFVVMAFIVRDEARLNPVGPVMPAPGAERGGLVFKGTANVWEVNGRMAIDAERRAHVSFNVRGPAGQPPSPDFPAQVALDMPEHTMEALRPTTSWVGPGAYVATAALPMDGRWRLRIEFPEITGVFLIDVD